MSALRGGSGERFIGDLIGGGTHATAAAPGSMGVDDGDAAHLSQASKAIQRSFGRHNAVYRSLKSALNTKDICAKRPREVMEEAVAEACEAWTQLDDKYISKRAALVGKKGMPSGSSYLAIPKGMDVLHGDRSNIRDLKHGKIDPNCQEEYFSKLFDIFEDLPRYSTILELDNETYNDENINNEESGGSDGRQTVPPPAQALATGTAHARMIPHDELRALRYLRGKLRHASSRDAYPFDETSVAIAPSAFVVGSYGKDAAPQLELVSNLVFEIDVYSSQEYYKKHMVRQSQIALLGSQSLQQLHDSIYCSNCKDTAFDAFVFIGDKFYVPSHVLVGRASPTLKLINDIEHWISSSSSTTEPRVAALDGVTMSELNVEIGKEYLYCHGGCCEHIVVVSDIRTYSPRLDPRHVTDFPAQKSRAFRKRRKCGVCKAMFARMVVFGDRLADSNPFYYCDHCYYMLHYDAVGELQYSDYQVYQYSHDML